MIVIGVILVALGGITAVLFFRKRKTTRLRTQFGPEYARALQDSGSRKQGEAGLQKREKRVEAFALRPLEPSDRERYVASWRKVQAQFVDDPRAP
jgi:hypothetical protein